MVRPQKIRRITNKPTTSTFNNDPSNTEIILLKIDEYEAIRLSDYHNIKQTTSAELMGISQPTYHRILSNARKKIATALIEQKQIKIIGETYMKNQYKYICQKCNLEWTNPEKEYETCPSCNSKNIEKITDEPLNQRKSFGGPGLNKCINNQTIPTECKCPKCGHSIPKIKGKPCKNEICPKCQIPLKGSNTCNIN